VTKRDRNQGQLEAEILALLWDARESGSAGLTAAAIVGQLRGDLALTTVLTVLGRLRDKSLVERSSAETRGYVFSAAQTRAQHHADLLLKIVESDSNLSMTFAHFAKGLSATDLKQLKATLQNSED